MEKSRGRGNPDRNDFKPALIKIGHERGNSRAVVPLWNDSNTLVAVLPW